jgi:hypothetical protein
MLRHVRCSSRRKHYPLQCERILLSLLGSDGELRLVAALRRAARERGGPLLAIDVADALLDEGNSGHRTS